MKLIERPHYLKQLVSARHPGDHREPSLGKSKRMALFIEWLACDEPDVHVIDIDLTSLMLESLREYHRMSWGCNNSVVRKREAWNRYYYR